MILILPSIGYAILLIALLLLSKKIAYSAQSSQEDVELLQPDVGQGVQQNVWLHLAIFILLLIHGLVCFRDIVSADGIVFGFAQALSMMAWIGVAVYWMEGWYFNLRGMMPMIIAIAMFSSFLPSVFEGAVISRGTVYSHGFILHFITANIAFGVLFLAAVQAILIGWQEKNLRSQFNNKEKNQFSFSNVLLLGQKKAFLEQLPPLVVMEKVLFNMIGIGFVILTIAVFSGVFFSQELFGRPLTFDHKTVFSIISWLLFGGILFVHWNFGLRGSQSLKWIIGSFIVLLLSYVGSRFVLEVILQRM